MKYFIILGIITLCSYGKVYSQKTVKSAATHTFKTNFFDAKSTWQSVLTHKILPKDPAIAIALAKLNIDDPLLNRAGVDPFDYLDLYFNLRKIVNGPEACTGNELSKLEYMLYNVKSTAIKKRYFNKIVKPELGSQGMTDSLVSLFRDAELAINDPQFIAANQLEQSKYKLIAQKAAVPQFKLKDGKGNVISPASFKGKVMVIQVLDQRSSQTNLAQQITFEKTAAKFEGDSTVVFLQVTMKGTAKIPDGKSSVINLLRLTPVNPTAFKEQFILTRLPRQIIIAKDVFFASHLNIDENLAVFVNFAKLQ